MLLVESHYLKEYGGTFTENFYGIKRERAPGVRKLSRTVMNAPEVLDNVVKLRTRDRYAALAFIVGIPYVKARMDEAYEASGGTAARLLGNAFSASEELRADATAQDKIVHYAKKYFRRIYPGINIAYHLSIFYYHVAYLFDNSSYHTPWHAIIRQRLRRLDGQDYQLFESRSKQNVGLPPNSSLSPLAFSRFMLPKGLNALKVVLPMGIFFLKFLEWWQASDFAKQLSAQTANTVELPPPDRIPPKNENFQQSKSCKICGKEITNPVALPTGYVFCYPCAYRWVQEHGSCPVTDVRILEGVAGLRRLMI